MQYTSFVDVLLILTRGDEVLLARRANTGYSDGLWNLPSGKLDAGEDLEAGMIREAWEEIGIELSRKDIRMANVVHYQPPDEQTRIGFFFHADSWSGEPFNAEPDKCSDLRWFARDEIPADTVPYTSIGLDLFRRGEHFGLAGWTVTAESARNASEIG
ncbi:NUDIX domain-containing protein [Nocardia sp. SYP-A9097]|uniref:NUDIX hydrolase n=1 Tax=Nocardia sp. SYP-A9097 TaxID=2663237 RepID=UPI00129BD56F|nr:NUDIX domain-containing protein [Nocardia sp. SYP-A9097]MRH87488.1 NUDIX domain-containing protein [Nocardia sp. SYP-A9097]